MGCAKLGAMDHRTAQTITLRDGRTLGYAEYGDPSGKPLFWFHGFPGCRLEGQLADGPAQAAGVRLISTDRPGMGLSTFQRHRTFLDWPEDVRQLADSLGVERFAVAGISGGGPYAAVCALKLAGRLTAAGIISGVGPLRAKRATEGMSRQNRMIFWLGGHTPLLPEGLMWLMARQARNPRQFVTQMRRSFADVDRPFLDRPEIQEVFIAETPEAFRQGSRGPAYELRLYSRSWGFRLRDVSMPVYLWQGEADTNVPPSMARYLAKMIPDCRATFYPGEGHLMAIDRMPEILSALLATRKKRAAPSPEPAAS
jgi:pimeloyl-ACP methyl ester carboxylesterase